MHCDVLIIGGGSAGLAAAVAAGRAAARTVMIERHGSLGGMASASLVHSICGLYRLTDQPEPIPANPSLPMEVAGRLLSAGGGWGPHRFGRVDVLLQHPTALSRMADQLVHETESLELRLHTELIHVHARSDAIEAVEVICRGRRETIEPNTVIDASGDGVAAAMAGAHFDQAETHHLQRPAFIFSLMGVDPSAVSGESRMKLARRIAGAVREGRLPEGTLGAALRATDRAGETFVTIDLEPPGDLPYDPTEPTCLTALEVHGRFLATELAKFLRAEVDGFENSAIAAFPTRIGVRESRRVMGGYCVDADDLQRGAEFDDAVALATWPREMRENTRGPQLRYPDDNRPCEIPLRALCASAMGNLFVAGRCISCSHEAQASLRVIGTCLATGEAAGLAAARGAAGGPVDAAAVAADRRQCVMPIAEPWVATASAV